MDRNKMAHELAVAFAVARQEANQDDPKGQMERLLEDYCAAYGYFDSRDDAAIKELTRRAL